MPCEPKKIFADLNVLGKITAASADFAKNLEVESLTVTNAATIGTTLGVTGATTLETTLGVTGVTTLGTVGDTITNVIVHGKADLKDTLNVTGLITAAGGLSATGGNIVAANNISGANITSTGQVSGSTLLATSSLEVTGNITANGALITGNRGSNDGKIQSNIIESTTLIVGSQNVGLKLSPFPSSIGAQGDILKVTDAFGTLTYTADSAGDLPSLPPITSITEDYLLSRIAYVPQNGFSITFPTNDTGDFDSTFIQGLGFDTFSNNTGTSLRFENSRGNAGASLIFSAGVNPGLTISCTGAAQIGSIEDKIDSWVSAAAGIASRVILVKINASTIHVFNKDRTVDGDVATIVTGAGGRNDFNAPEPILADRPKTPNSLPDPEWTLNLDWGVIVVNGSVGDSGTSTGGGSLALLRVDYNSKTYYRIFASNGLSEVISTSTDETDTAAVVASKTYEVA